MSTNTIDLLTVEIEEPSEGAFVIGLSEVGDTLSPTGAGMEWFEVTCETASIDVERGGQIEGPSTSIDVGTMSLTYVDGSDPASDVRIRPGVRCRAQVIDGLWPIYTGTIEDVQTDYDEDHVYTRLSAVDAVRTLASTPRFGAITANGSGHEAWQNRANRLLTSSPVPFNAPGSVFPATYEVIDSGWSVFGVVPPGQSASAIDDGDAAGGYFRVDAPTVSAGTSVIYTSHAYGIENTLTGLTVGCRYVLVWPLWFQTTYPQAVVGSGDDTEGHLYYAISIDGEWGEPFKIQTAVDATTGIRWPTASFVASATTADIQLARAFSGTVTDRGNVSFYPEAVHSYGLKVYGYTSDQHPVIDTPHETNLANHLQILADSSGASWWIDNTNGVVFTDDFSDPDLVTGLHFSDDSDDHGTAGHVCIVEAEISYDTNNAVSVVKFDNLGAIQERQNAPDTVDSRTVYADSGNHLYGRREGSITTTLPLGHIENRADELFSNPSISVQSITFDYADLGTEVFDFDLGFIVTVTARGATADYIVIGIGHTITPTSWLIQLTLRPQE